MKRIHGILFTLSMVLAFITLIIFTNLSILDYEQKSIMYWGFGFIALWYVLSWIIVVKVVLAIVNKVRSKF